MSGAGAYHHWVHEQYLADMREREARLQGDIEAQLCGQMGRFVGAGPLTSVFVRVGLNSIYAGLCRYDMIEAERFHERIAQAT